MTIAMSTPTATSHTFSTASSLAVGADPFNTAMHSSAAKTNTFAIPAALDAQSLLEKGIYLHNNSWVNNALAYGANPNACDANNITILERAVVDQNVDAVRSLLAHNVNVYATNRFGMTARDIAEGKVKHIYTHRYAQNSTIAGLLEYRQKQPFRKEPKTDEELAEYSWYDAREAEVEAELAISRGGVFNEPSPRPLKKGVNPEASMLENAIRLSDRETVVNLLEANIADLEARNKKGQKPLDVAREVYKQHAHAEFSCSTYDIHTIIENALLKTQMAK